MLHFEGDKDFTQPADWVWSKLRDAGFVASCIPGVESTAQAERDEAVFILRPGFSFVRGNLDVKLQMTDGEAANAGRVLAQSKGIGTTSKVEAAFSLAARDGVTHVHWTADITELGGLLKAAPQGLIKASAQKVISDIWTAIEARLSES